MSRNWQVVVADCVEYLRTLPESSLDSCVCDPPYLLGFMGKDFDEQAGAHLDPVAMQAWHLVWSIEVFRVLKPGGHLLAFGGTRTYHRLACAVEDAGFEIRDTINWVYASGFPKSHNVGKAVDDELGIEPTEFAPNPTERPGNGPGATTSTGWVKPTRPPVPLPESDEAKEWSGWGTALKPAHEPILVARKPLIGTVVENVLKFGTGALNIDGTRVGTIAGKPWGGVHPHRGKFPGWDVDSDLVPAPEPSPLGRWPPNLVLTHSTGCRPAGTKTVPGTAFYARYDYEADEPSRHELCGGGKGLRDGAKYAGGTHVKEETLEAGSCVPGCPVAEMDRQSGESESHPHFINATVKQRIYGNGEGFAPIAHVRGVEDQGGASRFFPTFSWDVEEVSFIYEPKASRSEREEGLGSMEARNFGQSGGAQNAIAAGEETYIQEGFNRIKKVKNHHPTVKPIALLRWLCRLVTPPGGTVLDPFAGSGSCGCAAIVEGFDYVGVEKEPEYAEIAKARVAYWKSRPVSQAPTNSLVPSRRPSITLLDFALTSPTSTVDVKD